jgi:hypothetical protein
VTIINCRSRLGDSFDRVGEGENGCWLGGDLGVCGPRTFRGNESNADHADHAYPKLAGLLCLRWRERRIGYVAARYIGALDWWIYDLCSMLVWDEYVGRVRSRRGAGGMMTTTDNLLLMQMRIWLAWLKEQPTLVSPNCGRGRRFLFVLLSN